MNGLDAARAELRDRLGLGARYDDPAAPARDLLWARTGTAYFARKLNELSDADLVAVPTAACRSRRQIVAGISYQARALAQCVEWIRHGIEKPEIDPFEIDEQVNMAVTLQPGALRHLFHHSAIHLNVEWRDLTASGWSAEIAWPDGSKLSARASASIRARSLWFEAVNLGNGGALADLPADLIASARASLSENPSYNLDPSDRSGTGNSANFRATRAGTDEAVDLTPRSEVSATRGVPAGLSVPAPRNGMNLGTS